MIIGVDIRFGGAVTGVEEYARQLFLALISIDKKNRYLFFRSGFKKYNDDFWPNIAFEMGRLVELPWPNKVLNPSFKIFKRPYLDKSTGKLDLWFMPNYNLFSLRSAKTVITIHDLSFERFPHFFSRKRRLWHKFVMPRLRAAEADHIITDSQSTKSDLMELYDISSDKISVISLGVRPIFRFPISDQSYLKRIRDKYSLPEKYIFSLSTLEPRKNLNSLFEAYNLVKKNNPEVGLVVAGIKGWLYQDIIKGDKDNVKFLGFVDDVDKPALYSLASVFVYPAFFEGFGFPPLEAMASGIPVIVSDTSSLPEVVKGAAFMVNPYKVSEIAWAINEILLNETFKTRLRLKGLEVAKDFNWKETAESTLAVWERVVYIKPKT